MNNVKLISRILFYLTRFLGIFYFSTAAYSMISLTTGWSLHFREDKKYFQVRFPFSETAFLNGDYNLIYIVFEFLLPLALYGLFFYWLSNVFRVFFQPKLFTASSIKHLKRFYLGNFLIPGVMVILVGLLTQMDKEAVIVVVLHAIIGVFAYYLAAIFKQGLNLQNEQDLII